jgi:hypothetical protein
VGDSSLAWCVCVCRGKAIEGREVEVVAAASVVGQRRMQKGTNPPPPRKRADVASQKHRSNQHTQTHPRLACQQHCPLGLLDQRHHRLGTLGLQQSKARRRRSMSKALNEWTRRRSMSKALNEWTRRPPTPYFLPCPPPRATATPREPFPPPQTNGLRGSAPPP